MLTKTTNIDKIEIVSDFKIVQLREATIIKEDGVEISKSFHRRVITPSDDITNEPQEIQDICLAVHTQAVKDAYMAHVSQE